MPNSILNKSNYIKYRWTPEHTRFERQGKRYQRLNVAATVTAIAATIGALIFGMGDQVLQMSLFGLALIAIAVNVLYDFKDHARRSRGIADALRREREMFEAGIAPYNNSDRAFSRFVRRCEAILQTNGDGYQPIMVEEDDDEKDKEKSTRPSPPADNPFSRSSSLRSRLGSSSSSSSRFGSSRRADAEDDDDDEDDDDSSSRSRFSNNSPFGRSSGSSGSNPFGRSSSSGSGSPFSRPANSPFGSNARYSGGRPVGSSGGMRREGTDDPALSGIQSGNGKTGVRFAAYYPKELAPDNWQAVKAYAFMGYAVDAVAVDAENGDPEKLPEILYDRNRNVRYRIPEGAQVTVTPHMKGFQFNPQNVSIGFYRTWHRFDFEMRAVEAKLDEATNGYLTFTVDGLVVADVPLSVYVSKGGRSSGGDVIRHVMRKPYRAIYPSFADRDRYLAERFERVFEALGMYTMRDLMQLRAKGEWNTDMLKSIENADVFQLFWSEAAANSETVAQELSAALERQDRSAESLIRAVYWEHPPTALPENISNLTPDYLPDIAE